jgi:hypothetical protein
MPLPGLQCRACRDCARRTVISLYATQRPIEAAQPLWRSHPADKLVGRTQGVHAKSKPLSPQGGLARSPWPKLSAPRRLAPGFSAITVHLQYRNFIEALEKQR